MTYVLLNGAFGIGKTTVARALRRRLRSTVIVPMAFTNLEYLTPEAVADAILSQLSRRAA